MSDNQLRLLRFALRYPSGWHTYAEDAARDAHKLSELGLLEVNEYHQFRLAINRVYLANDYD